MTLARATDPSTPADELREIAKLHTPDLLRALGGNPSAPLDLLLHLAVWVPGRVLRNEALSLHALSLGPRMLEQATHESLDALLGHPDGASLLPMAVDCASGPAGGVALRTRRLSPELLGRLAARADLHTLRTLAREPSLPRDTLVALARHGEAMIREAAASNPSLPLDAQRALLADPGVSPWSLLNNPNLDPAIAVELLDHGSPEIRKGAVACPRLPVEAAERCARHAEPSIRAEAAGNPSLPAPTLAKLTGDRDPLVRAEAAASDRLSPRLLDLLASDPSDRVRAAVASNGATPLEALAQLAEDPEEGVREAAASNPNTPLESLESLGQPPHPPIFALLENPRLPGPLARALVRQVLAGDPEEHELTELLTCPVLPAEYAAEVLKRNGFPAVSFLPASTPEALLRELASAGQPARRLVARHRMAPIDLLHTLAWDRDPAVTCAARASLAVRRAGLDE